MFFILNAEHAVVAADQSFLQKTGAGTIYRLADYFLDQNAIDHQRSVVLIQGEAIPFTRQTVTTLWGEGTLYRLGESSGAATDDLAATDALQDAEILAALAPDPAAARPEPAASETTDEDDLMLDLLEPDAPDAPPHPGPEHSSDAPLDLGLGDLDTFGIADESAAPSAPKPDKEDTLDLGDFGDLLGAGAGAAAGAGLAALGDDDAPASHTETAPDSSLDLSDLGGLDLGDEKGATGNDASDLDVSFLLDEASTPEATPDEPRINMDDLEIPFSAQEETTSTPATPESIPPETPAVAPAAVTPSAATPPATDVAVDYQQNADYIGISVDEYVGFIEQYVEEALRNESLFYHREFDDYRERIVALEDASQLLLLNPLAEQLRGLEHAQSEARQGILDSYYQTVRHLHKELQSLRPSGRGAAAPATAPASTPSAQTPPPPQTPSAEATAPQPATPEPATPTPPVAETAPEAAVEPAPATEPATEPEPVAEAQTTPPPSQKEEAITPADVDVDKLLAETQPLRFDFSTNVASEELGLPEPLVREFVSDFIVQAKENIPILYGAYEQRQLNNLQTTAHLLKGASSNLRIDPLAETLKQLQYNDDFDKVPSLMERFIAQLKALDTLINQTGL